MLFETFAALAAGLPSRSGLHFKGQHHPYGALAEQAARLAGGLVELGIGPGTAVALLVPNSPDLFVCAYALFAIGAIAVPLSPGANRRELASAGRSCNIGAVIAGEQFTSAGTALIADLAPKPLLPLIVTGSGSTVSLRSLMARPPASLPAVATDAVAIHLFSSGSTGRPKVVPHTHAEMLAEGRGVAEAEGLTPDDIVLNSLPGHHGFGFMSVHFEATAVGATTLYWSDPQPMLLARAKLLETLEAERVTVFPGVPFVFDALCGAGGGADLSRLRSCFTGGVGLKRPVFEKFRERFGIALGQAYGCTESGQVAFNDGRDADAWDSVGKPQGNASISIVPGADGQTGEVLIRAQSLTTGYLGAHAASNAAFRDGGFYTGDLGRIDTAGNLHITGRSKLIIEVAGHKIDPLEVEDVLATHPAVAEAVVVGVPDPRTGEQRLKLVAVLRGEAGADDLMRFARAHLSAQKVPAMIEFRDEIPKSATGKILRGRLIAGD